MRQLRCANRVFYLEQHVTTLDADEKDPFSLFLWAECEGQTVGFLRMIPRGIAYAEPSIGRVCVARTYRRRGICREMVSRAIGYMVREWRAEAIRISGPKLFDTLLRIIRIRGRIGRIPGSGHSA